MDDTKLLTAIREGTLSDDEAKGQLLKRRHAIAIDEGLPPDLRARALEICDNAFKSGIFEATNETLLFVTFLRDVMEAIALVYVDQDARLTPSPQTRTSTLADATEHTLEPESDLEHRPAASSRGGRSRSVTLERSMVVDAVEARRLRKRRAHYDNDTSERDPKRRLYGPPESVPRTKEPADASPSMIVKLHVPSKSDSNKSLGTRDVSNRPLESRNTLPRDMDPFPSYNSRFFTTRTTSMELLSTGTSSSMGYTVEGRAPNVKRVHFSDGHTAGSATPVDDFLFKRANSPNNSNAQGGFGTQASGTQSSASQDSNNQASILKQTTKKQDKPKTEESRLEGLRRQNASHTASQLDRESSITDPLMRPGRVPPPRPEEMFTVGPPRRNRSSGFSLPTLSTPPRAPRVPRLSTQAGALEVPTPLTRARALRLLKKFVEQGRSDKEVTVATSHPPPPPPAPPRDESQFLSCNLPTSVEARLRIPRDLFISPNLPESIQQLGRLLVGRGDLFVSPNPPASLPQIEALSPPPGATFPNRIFPPLPNQAGAPGVANSLEGEAREYITLAPFHTEPASSTHNLPPLLATVGDLLPRRHVFNLRPILPKPPTQERASSVVSQSPGPTAGRGARAASEPVRPARGRGRGRGRGRPRKVPAPSPLCNETIFPPPAQPIEPHMNFTIPIPGLGLPTLSVRPGASRIFTELFTRDSHMEDVTLAPDESRDLEVDAVERSSTVDQPTPSPPATSSLPPPTTPSPPPRSPPISISSSSSSSLPSSPCPARVAAPPHPSISISSSSSPSPSPSPTTHHLATFAASVYNPPSQPSHSTVVQPALSFPPYPTLTPRALPHFHTGAIIALENIRDDYAIAPDFSLLDLVENLEGNRPTVYDWEHVTIMRGGNWVFGVLREVWREWGVRVRVEDVVGELMEWVEREFERGGEGGGSLGVID